MIGATQDYGNAIIAKYMGYKRHGNTSAWINDKGDFLLVLSYHSCWSSLMKVIEKMDSISDRTDAAVYCQTNATSHTFYINYNDGNVINNNYPKYHNGRHRCVGENRITNVFLAIVPFLEWLYKNNLIHL